MVQAKFEKFPIHDQSIAHLARALSHPARTQILYLIHLNQYLSGEQIRALIPLAPATVSHHIQVLKKSKLIIVQQSQKNFTYSINYQKLHSRLSLLDLMRSIYLPQN
jgi:DNA-binding transcriptional ArsR family regulator